MFKIFIDDHELRLSSWASLSLAVKPQIYLGHIETRDVPVRLGAYMYPGF